MTRNATQDANEGQTQLRERSQSVARFQGDFAVSQEVSTGEALGRGMQAMQTALSAYSTGAASDPSAMMMEQGAREGVAEAVKANKRSKFAEFFFGQDAGYSEAVGQATKTFANNEYIRQAAEMENHLGLTPEAYAKKVNHAVTERIKDVYGDDLDAQRITMETWQNQSRKLAREHAAKHMVFSQEQLYTEGVNDLTSQFDIIHLNNQEGSTEDAQLEATEDLQALLSPSYRYTTEGGKTATVKASRNIQVKAVERQLMAGNTSVLKALPDNFYEGLTPQQATRMDRAKQSYDIAIANESEVIVEEGLLMATKGDLTGLSSKILELQGVQSRLSGSAISRDKFNEDLVRMNRHLYAGRTKAAKERVKGQNIKDYYMAREEGDAGAAGAGHSQKVQEGADDLVVATAALRVASQQGLATPRTASESINMVLSNPSAMETVATKASRYGSISPSFAEAAKQQVMNLRPDESGYISEADRAKLDNLRTLYDKAPGAMRKALGPDASAVIEITLSNSREPVKEILNKRSNYVKNKGITLSKAELGIPPEQTMSDFVKQKLGGEQMDSAAVSYYTEQLKTGYRIYGGDTRAAEKYMKDLYRVNNQEWKGNTIENAGLIEQDVPSLLQQLEDTGMGQALVALRIPADSQDPNNPYRGFGDLNDVQIQVNPGTKELIVGSSEFSYPVVLSAATLEKLAAEATKARKELNDAREQAEMSVYKQQASEAFAGGRYWPNPNEGAKPILDRELTTAEKYGWVPKK